MSLSGGDDDDIAENEEVLKEREEFIKRIKKHGSEDSEEENPESFDGQAALR